MKTERIKITPQCVKFLNDEKLRTGKAPMALLRAREDVPEGLNSNIITAWMLHDIRSAKRQHYDYVVNLYVLLPDNPWIEITPALRNEIIEIRVSTEGYVKNAWRKGGFDQYFTYNTISSVLRGKPKKIQHIVLEFLRSINMPSHN